MEVIPIDHMSHYKEEMIITIQNNNYQKQVRPRSAIKWRQYYNSLPLNKRTMNTRWEHVGDQHCLLFIVLFAKNYTNQIKSNYLNSHGEEAQEKPPGL